ncbi:MAG: hypothetical protein IKG92_00465 [Bacteroidales bacterium]|nr:hypothetical protein [Bacteroidales bacterium]
MMNFGYNNRWVRLVKDLLFCALCIWFITMRRPFAIVVGVLGLAWYGRDAWFQAKVLWQEKHYQAPQPDVKAAPKDDKITVTNLSDAKEVNFEKE